MLGKCWYDNTQVLTLQHSSVVGATKIYCPIGHDTGLPFLYGMTLWLWKTVKLCPVLYINKVYDDCNAIYPFSLLLLSFLIRAFSGRRKSKNMFMVVLFRK